MLRKKLFVALRKVEAGEKIQQYLEAHLEWMIAAEKRGHIFASGPIVNDDGGPHSLGGLTLVRAESLSEAHDIIGQDPFIKQDVFSADLYEWQVMEGKITIELNFHDRSFGLN